MPLNIVNVYLLPSFLLVILLTACNGNSFNNTDYPTDGIVQLDKTQNINQGIDLLLHYPDD
ncbi:MAG: hypothetical protein ACI9F1_002546, partial [Colwellia sp.]